MPNSHPPHTAKFTVDNSMVEISTDDDGLAALLRNSQSEDNHDLINAVSASDTQHKQSASDLRQRNKAPNNTQVSGGDQHVSPSELARLIKDSPFLDTSSPMTAWEWFKIITLLPWTIFRIVVATPCVGIVWCVISLLVWRQPINTPLSKWRRVFMNGWIRQVCAAPCFSGKGFSSLWQSLAICMLAVAALDTVLVVCRAWTTLLVRLGLDFFTMKVTGKEHIAEAQTVRPIIVFNHVSYLDGIILASIFAPTGIAKASVATMPFFGVCTRALQFLFILRRGTTDEQNKHILSGKPAEMIAKRAVDPR